jgi:hypothetical protein
MRKPRSRELPVAKAVHASELGELDIVGDIKIHTATAHLNPVLAHGIHSIQTHSACLGTGNQKQEKGGDLELSGEEGVAHGGRPLEWRAANGRLRAAWQEGRGRALWNMVKSPRHPLRNL